MASSSKTPCEQISELNMYWKILNRNLTKHYNENERSTSEQIKCNAEQMKNGKKLTSREHHRQSAQAQRRSYNHESSPSESLSFGDDDTPQHENEYLLQKCSKCPQRVQSNSSHTSFENMPVPLSKKCHSARASTYSTALEQHAKRLRDRRSTTKVAKPKVVVKPQLYENEYQTYNLEKSVKRKRSKLCCKPFTPTYESRLPAKKKSRFKRKGSNVLSAPVSSENILKEKIAILGGYSSSSDAIQKLTDEKENIYDQLEQIIHGGAPKNHYPQLDWIPKKYLRGCTRQKNSREMKKRASERKSNEVKENIKMAEATDRNRSRNYVANKENFLENQVKLEDFPESGYFEDTSSAAAQKNAAKLKHLEMECERARTAHIPEHVNNDSETDDYAHQYGVNMGKIPSNTIIPKQRHGQSIDPHIFYYKPPESNPQGRSKDIEVNSKNYGSDRNGHQVLGSLDRNVNNNFNFERNSSKLRAVPQNVDLLKHELMSNLLQEKRSRSPVSDSDSPALISESRKAGVSHFPTLSTQPLCVCEDVETSFTPLNQKSDSNKQHERNIYDSSDAQQSSVETEADDYSNSHCNDNPTPFVNHRQLTYPTQFQNCSSHHFKRLSRPSYHVDKSGHINRTVKQIKSKEINSCLSIPARRCDSSRRSHINHSKQNSNWDLNSIYKGKIARSEKKRKRKRCTHCSSHCMRSGSKYIHRKMSMSAELNEESECCVRVAVRIRPQNSREKIDLCRVCTTVTSGEPQIVLGLDKAFTYDYVFDMESCQRNIYEMCVERLVEGALNGYNATVLAYGQTGSGKTFTMGTGFERDLHDAHIGIIPRAVHHIFAGIDDLQSRCSDEEMGISTRGALQFSVAVQFIELYNEDIIDLLDPYSKDRTFKIHENGNREITITGATIKPIHSPEDALKCLQQGALARTTASTKMNDQSSRSHALFTILIRRQRVLPENDLETLTSKFNFVDLAGSERLKRTGATGERAREGISINCGLLALGNCISALGDISKKATHVPYRDSKLTRLLQDSLGGNSQTLMIACISPSDRDFMETLNTLKYANRARNIKNRVQINQDQSSRTICQLRREIAALQLELLEFKQGKRNTDGEGNSALTDTFHENAMLIADNRRLKQRIKSLQETINVVTEKNIQLKLEKETHGWSPLSDSENSVTTMIGGYLSEIEKLQAKLIESEEMYQQLKKSCNTSIFSPRSVCKANNGYENPDDLINLAKREIEKDREMLLMSRSMPDNTNNCNNADNPENTENEIYESDESDTESEEKTNEMQADLNDINSDIEIKSKLIEQLELSQQRMQLMRQHYEEKLDVLNSKIINTQKERDEVLSNMSTKHGSPSNDQVKKVRDEYERKINDMHRELKKLQQAQREHARQQREMQAQEAKLRNLRAELDDLKSSKTRLMRKISEQTNRHKEEDTRRIREIAQLRKEQRRQQNTVKSLQAKMQAKDQILKRKTEEVTALRRNQRSGLSQKAAGRVNKKDNPATFNKRVARQRWDHIFRSISRAARNKQLLVQLEQELERLMRERDELSHELANVRNRQRLTKSSELANEEDTIKSNLNYVQENISLVQQSIMECEEGKEASNNDTQSLQDLIYNIKNLEEAQFVLERLTDSAVMLTCNSSLTQSRLQEHETLLKEVQQESSVQQQLLQHFLSQNNAAKISDLFDSLNLGKVPVLSSTHFKTSQASLHSNDTYDIPPGDGPMNNSSYAIESNSKSRSTSPVVPMIDLSYDKTGKVRRRTAQPQDLLFGDNENNPMTRSFTQQEAINRNLIPLMRVPSAPGSLKQTVSTSVVAKRSNELSPSTLIPQSPRLSRRTVANKTTGLDNETTTTPQSPPVYRKMTSRDDTNSVMNDVFSRLGAGTQDPLPGGSIQRISGKIRSGVPLFCTHTVSGHNNSVLSIKVENDILYTAAADRTVKVWDLAKETAQHCLSAHYGPVVAIQNDNRTNLLFSASGPYVRVWDLRTSNSKPIKTLTSSGQVLSANASISGMVAGESPITALCMGATGNLYVAASDKVRIWELSSLSCIGKLSGGHQAAVMCVTAWEGSSAGTDFVASGSKDHYVKVYEVSKSGGIVSPLLNLEPPHYDGVQALAVADGALGAEAELFSGSRDSGIKRWDLKTGELKQSLNNAHKGWVSGMAISGDILLSSCRGGVIRLWNIKTCEPLAEMKTDLMINDIVAAGQRVYTATSDGKVRMYRFTSSLRRNWSQDNS